VAKCKVCGSEFHGESAYCDNCLKENKNHSSESYLDDLLKSMVNQPSINQNVNIKKKTIKNIDPTNEKSEIENKDEQEDNILENKKYALDEQNQFNNDAKDILALEEENQDILALEEDGNINEVIENDDSSSDILSLHDNIEEDSSLEMKDGILNIHEDLDDSIRDNKEVEEIADNQNDTHEDNDNNSLTSDFESMNEADDDLVALLGMITGLEESSNESNNEDVFAIEEKEDNWNEDTLITSEEKNEPSKSKDSINNITSSSKEDTDNNDLLNDILSIDSLLGDEPIQANADKNPENLSEVFSDSLSAIHVLRDQVKNEDTNEEDTSLEKETKNREEVKKKKWAKIFGSNKKEAKEIEQSKEKPKKKEKVKKMKKTKKVKLKDKALASDKNNLNQEEEQHNKKAAKVNKVKDKKDAKNKKEKVKKKNTAKVPDSNIKEVMEEDNSGKISKAGTSFVIIFCCLIAIFIIVGTNLYTYSLNIHKAESDFERQRYTDAYNNIYGYKVKSSDMDLYNKIMTVMYVNKQLNSFYNYSSLNKQPEALDSLLKGLTRYEEVVDKAISLGVKEDIDSVKSQIVVELESKYNIKEKEALAIIYTEDKDEYTQYILNAVTEKVN
jgi:hypothetical protein